MEGQLQDLSLTTKHKLGLWVGVYGFIYIGLVIYAISHSVALPRLPSWTTIKSLFTVQLDSTTDHDITAIDLQPVQRVGLFSLILIACYGISYLYQGTIFFFLDSETHCDSDSGLVALPRCVTSLSRTMFIIMITPVYCLDLLLHNLQWGRLCQDAVLEAFSQNVDWRKYKRDPVSWDELDMIAAVWALLCMPSQR